MFMTYLKADICIVRDSFFVLFKNIHPNVERNNSEINYLFGTYLF